MSSAPGPAGKKRPAATEPAEGGGVAKKHPRGGGGVTSRPGKGARKKEPSKCPHQRQRSQCKECGDSGICPHERIKSQCKECGGESICPHQRQKSRCKECGVGGKRPAPTDAGGEDHDGNYSRKEKSLRLLCDKFLQEYSSAAEVSAAFALWSAFWHAWELVLLPVSCALWS